MNLYLIGARGSGKSTVAPLVAERLGRVSIDVDREIESLAGQSIAEIFDQDGVSMFRQWEATVVAAIALADDKVVALGGGAPVAAENRARLKESGKVVWLIAQPEVLFQRTQADPASGASRPALTDRPGIEEVRQLVAERHDAYADCADFIVETDQRTPEEIADQIVQWWNSVDKQA